MEVLRCYPSRVLAIRAIAYHAVSYLCSCAWQVMDHKRVRQYSIAPGDVVHLIRKER